MGPQKCIASSQVARRGGAATFLLLAGTEASAFSGAVCKEEAESLC